MTDDADPAMADAASPQDSGPGPRRVETSSDARVIRRALTAGGVVGGVVSLLGLAGVFAVGGGGALGLAAVLGGLTLGAAVVAAWLLLSVVFDLLAGRSPTARRLWWGLGVAVVAFVTPVLLLGALSAAAG